MRHRSLARTGSALRATAFLTTGRLAAFLPFADFGAGLLAGINGSSKQHQPREERAIIPADPGLYRCFWRGRREASVARWLGQDGCRGSPGLFRRSATTVV